MVGVGGYELQAGIAIPAEEIAMLPDEESEGESDGPGRHDQAADNTAPEVEGDLEIRADARCAPADAGGIRPVRPDSRPVPAGRSLPALLHRRIYDRPDLSQL